MQRRVDGSVQFNCPWKEYNSFEMVSGGRTVLVGAGKDPPFDRKQQDYSASN